MPRWRRPARVPPPPEDLRHHFALGLVGDIEGFVSRLHDDAEEWPEVEILAGPPDAPLLARTRPDLVWVRIRSTFSPRSSAVLRPLAAARSLGLRAGGWVPLDAQVEASTDWISEAVAGWVREKNHGPHRRHLESLAGPVATDWLASRAGASRLPVEQRTAASFGLGCVVFNTADPALKVRLLEVAYRAASDGTPDDVRVANSLLTNVRPAYTLVAHGVAPLPGEGPLADLAASPHWQVSGPAVGLLTTLPPPRTAGAVQVLCDLARPGLGELTSDEAARVESALQALEAASVTPGVVDLVEQLFDESPSARVRRQAGATLVALLGARARDVWVRLLESRDPWDVDTGEELVADHGDESDLEVALTAAHRLLRRRPADRAYHPPRGSDLLDFLARYRGNVEVDALFFEVTARWPRLPEELRDWLAAHHPWLVPDA